MALALALALATLTPAPCAHESSTASRAGGDIACAWECDDCGHLRPFTADDFEFCNASPWTPRAPEGIAPLAWWLMSTDARLAVLRG